MKLSKKHWLVLLAVIAALFVIVVLFFPLDPNRMKIAGESALNANAFAAVAG